MDEIIFEKLVPEDELVECLRNITFRGLYDQDGNKIRPYKNAKFSLVTVHPPEKPTGFPQVMRDLQPQPLFSAQPTIYKTQTDMLLRVEEFLKRIGKDMQMLKFEGILYEWKGRGKYHVIPPIIELHSYPLSKGTFDLAKIRKQFRGTFVKDATGKLHELSQEVIRNFYVDDDSKISYMNIFNSNAELINYGMKFSGDSDFYIICDGSHRIDLALEIRNKPTTAILVESDDLLPYYAFPMPFRPTTRLTSKEAEKKYPKLERDKIHLLNDFIKKVLHYDWETGGLFVSKLRSNHEIN